MRTIRASAFEQVSFGPRSVVATHKATNWKYYPLSPLNSDVRVIVSDRTIGFYTVQNDDASTEDVVVRYPSDFVPCKRCRLICDPIEERPFGACRWHTKAPVRMPLSEFRSDPSMLSDKISVNELVSKLHEHVSRVLEANAQMNQYYGSLMWLYSRLDTVIRRHNIDTSLMVKVARHKYDAFDDAWNGNDYDSEVTARLSTGKYAHDRWTCCGQVRKDALGCWIGDHSFNSVDPCLHDASRYIRGSEHVALSRMRDVHLEIEAAPTLQEKILHEATFNSTFGAIYLAPEMMWVFSPTSVGVIDANIPPVEYPKLEREFREVNTARDVYRYDIIVVLPNPRPTNVESSEDVERAEQALTLGRFEDFTNFDSFASRLENLNRLEQVIGNITPALRRRVENVNNLLRYTPCFLGQKYESYAIELLKDIATAVFETRPENKLHLSFETHDYFLARDISSLITKDIVAHQRISNDVGLLNTMDEILSVTFSLKPTLYRAALPDMTRISMLVVATRYGQSTAKTYVQLSWLLHSFLFGPVRDGVRNVAELIANRLNLLATGRLLEGFTFNPNLEADVVRARAALTKYINLFAGGYFFVEKISAPRRIVQFMEHQLLFIEALNVVYDHIPLHLIETHLLDKDFQVGNEQKMSLIDRVMEQRFADAMVTPSNLPEGPMVEDSPVIGSYYLLEPAQRIELNRLVLPNGLTNMLESVGDYYNFKDIARWIGLRLMIDTITERFGFDFQERLARLACYMDYAALLSLDKGNAQPINDALQAADTQTVFSTDLLNDLLIKIESAHVRLIVEWTKNIFAKRFEKSVMIDFELMNRLNTYRSFEKLDSASDIVMLYRTFVQLRNYLETLKKCVTAYGSPKSKSLQLYLRFITAKYGVYSTTRFARCVAILDDIKEHAEDIDAFVLDSNERAETMQRQIDAITVDTAPFSYQFQQFIKQNPNVFIASKLFVLLKTGTLIEDAEREEQRANAINAFFSAPGDREALMPFRIENVWTEPDNFLYRAPVETARPLIELLMQTQRNSLTKSIAEIDNSVIDKTSANYVTFRKKVEMEFVRQDFEYNKETHFAALVSNKDGRFVVDAYCIYALSTIKDAISVFARGLKAILGLIRLNINLQDRSLFSIRHLRGDYLDILLYGLVEAPTYGAQVVNENGITFAMHVPTTFDIAFRRVLGEGCKRRHEDIAIIRTVDVEHYLTLSASLSAVPAFVGSASLSNQTHAIAFHNMVAELEPNCSASDRIDVWEIALYNAYVRISNNMVTKNNKLMMFKEQDGRVKSDDWLFTAPEIRADVANRLKLKLTRWQKARNAVRRMFGI